MSDAAATTIAGPDLNRFASAEWLLTNGLGGFAMGAPGAIPQRRYHAWLNAAVNPPVGRHVVLHSCAEWLVLPASAPGATERRIAISTYQFTGEVQSPDGATLLQSFTRGSESCRWVYRDASTGITISRELTLEQHVNRCTVKYSVQSAPQGARLEIRPFTPLRDFHTLERTHEQPETRLTQGRTPDEIAITRGGLSVALRCAPLHARQSSPSFAARAEWWRNFSYARDQKRGQEGLEDLYSHGVWTVALAAGGAGNESGCMLTCEVTSPDLGDLTPPTAASVAMPASIPQALRTAASQFVVRRVKPAPQKGSQTSIIAGYPWFSDWGRDTCISLPGLLLATGRLAEARQCLEAFAEMVEGGLVPNCFDNGSGHAEYNTADASLWYLNAAAELAKRLGLPLDPSGELSTIAGACLSIIHAYEHGTSFDIQMDPSDGLIIAGNAGTQLTWMDAKRDGVVFTPRHGKPVELSALWYNGLRRVGELLPANQARRTREISEIASWMDRSFEKAFWNEQGAHLFDCLAPRYASDGSRVGWEPSRQIRPN
ncbi:MAG: glycogen debranching enzyme N-terminal domain-containing protein, partial [Planctomycetota bacterium]|nr:glycogen debranching enzyme N-terminal domain-containing protein [Planctomycetota bacterium]